MPWPNPKDFLTLTLLLALSLSGSAQANIRTDQSYQNAQSSLQQWMVLPEQQTNYVSALAGPSLGLTSPETVRAAAEAGDPKAQCLLGLALAYGWWGNRVDPGSGRLWLEKAAEKAIPEAQATLGALLLLDTTNPDRESQALRLFEKSAKAGSPTGQFYLGLSLHFGRGAPADRPRARELYEQAVQAGFAPALCNLGLMYEEGLGGPPDLDKAVGLYRRAAIKAFPMGIHNLAVCYARGEGVGQDYSEALKYYRRAAILGYGPSMHNLANALMNGRGTAIDLLEAARWFKKSIQAGVSDSLAPHAALVLSGSVPGDANQALSDLVLSVEKGDLFGSYVLGSMYAGFAHTNLNRLVDQNDALGASLLRQPAHSGNTIAQHSLGILYSEGRGVDKDPAEAFKWLTLAQRGGQFSASTNLAALRASISPRDLAEGLRRAKAFTPTGPSDAQHPGRFLPQPSLNRSPSPRSQHQ